ncbi:50S ribosomal protein L32e [Methanofollis fontis]|uniref:Large ribosomal subunit protein eL32 n=1 Tax=Methanofollis fontis TaxID=2052832 RepID=A0A483CRR8_9EURY|nr:50S ribosomal protein L32e [Methanofollis fontis]TAJ45833.1 50S ribosomal protein L32e [Methanofollis fontis]
MADETVRLIRVRSAKTGCKFQRQCLHAKKKLKDTWRRPRGLTSKQRRQYKAKGAHPQGGYNAPVAVRGMHPSGYFEVLVYTPSDLEGLDAAVQAVRIGGSVGNKKRADIQQRALEAGLKVLNAKDLAPAAAPETEAEEAESDE